MHNVLGNLPFCKLNDEDFMRMLNDSMYIGHSTFSSELQNMCFNIFDANDKDSGIRLCDENDPDICFDLYKAAAANTSVNSNYHVEESFHSLSKNYCENSFSLLHYNLRSSVSHHGELDVYLAALNYKFSIVGLCETWLKDDNCDLFGLDGYDAEYKCRKNKAGGGVAVYVKQGMQYKRRDDLESILANQAEVIFLEMTAKTAGLDKDVIVAEVYRPPNCCVDDFNVAIEECLSCIEKENKYCYIMGDINVNLLNIQNHVPTAAYVNLMFEHMYVPLVNRPTRVTEHSASLIDHIFTNNLTPLEGGAVSGILYSSISDHLPVFHMCKVLHDVSSKDTFFKTQIINDRTVRKLRDRLSEQDWNAVTCQNDTNSAYSTFITMFNECLHHSIPTVTRKIRAHKKPWMTNGLLNSVRRKNKLYSFYVKRPCDLTRYRFKQYRNKVNHLIRISEKKYVRDYLEKTKGDVKKSWLMLNRLLCKKREVRYQNQLN